jgi:hypothetical protein
MKKAASSLSDRKIGKANEPASFPITTLKFLVQNFVDAPSSHLSGGFLREERDGLSVVQQRFLVKLLRAYGGCLGTKRR